MQNLAYSLIHITDIIKGELVPAGNTNTTITDILIDSRRLISAEQCLFFALCSKRNNGHKYISDLYNSGLRNFVVSTVPDNYLSLFKGANFVLVNDTLKALQLLSSHHRKSFELPIIGITGSNGKTIIKEWLYQLLNEDKNIVRSPKSYNSQIGVPLSVWQIDKTHELGIFEAGISEPEEMESLQNIILPSIGLFTNVGAAHDENFISLLQKAGEKLKLFTKVDTLIYCSDHTEIQGAIIRSEILKSIQSFTWSRKLEADFQIISSEILNAKTLIIGKYKNEEISIEIPFTDSASIENTIHCWSVMLFFGYDNKTISDRMQRLTTIAMRLELKEGINHCSIINDSYNSDFNSLNIALDFLSQQKQHKKKTLIISDILQSGVNDFELYKSISELVEKKGITKIIGIGPTISNHTHQFEIEKYFFNSTDDFLRQYPFTSFSNESILLKGARIFEFEQISKALQQKAHETVLEINLNSLVNNLNYYRSKIGSDIKIMGMVKAFSYGSGSFEIANILQFHNIDYLTVAYADEGIELRKAGINTPIMVMNPDEQSFDGMIKYNLEPEIYSFRVLDLLEQSIKKNLIPKNKPIKIHIKLDTGMHRLGFEKKDLVLLIEKLKSNKSVYLQSVFTHLSASEDPKHDDFSHQQIDCFENMSNELVSQADNHTVLRHVLNSAGINRFPQARFDMVRLGISMYGIATFEDEQEQLENVATLKSTISQIKHVKANETVGYSRSGKTEKDLTIAIVPIGYADGLSRILGNGNGQFLINGVKVSTIGNICMDMCMIDISDISANEGDEVIIFGKEYPIQNIAKDMHTIPYEILTSISRRVKRVYFQE